MQNKEKLIWKRKPRCISPVHVFWRRISSDFLTFAHCSTAKPLDYNKKVEIIETIV